MNKYNEIEMTCTCYEEVVSITVIPSTMEVCFNVARRTVGADGVMVGTSTHSVTEVLPADSILIETLLEEYTSLVSSD